MNISDFYNKMCQKHEESWQAAHWISQESQLDNFSLLSQIGPLHQDDKILDLGCGQGDLYEYLQRIGFQGTYEGIDISNEMINNAWTKFPDARFANIDFLDPKFNFQYEWIFASGTFNHKVSEDQYDYFRKALKKMYKLAKKGIGLVLMTKYDASGMKPMDYLFGYDPAIIADECFKLTPFVNINHTALVWGFVVFLYNKNWMSMVS